MRISASTVACLTIEGATNLDPIRVYLEDYGPGKGRITISCYDAAWVGYWGAMGEKSIQDFFISCDSDYLAGNMGCARSLKSNMVEHAYLVRVIKAVQCALREIGHVA